MASPPRTTERRLGPRRTDEALRARGGGSADDGGRSTLARVGAVVFVLAAAALVAFVLFGTGDGYRVTAVFPNAGQLVPGDQVQVGGRPIGTITNIEVTDDGRAEVEMELDEFHPVHEGTRANIRAASLSGIANRYIALDLAPNSEDEIEDGGEIAADKVQAPVDLDQLFNTLDDDTQLALQRVIKGSAMQLQRSPDAEPKSEQASQSLKYLNPALSTSSGLAREVVRDRVVLEQFLRDTSNTVGAIAERRGDLADLVGNANATARAIGDENVALARALELLPGTLRKANSTFVNLRSTLDDLDVLVAESKPATRELAPFLRELRPLVRESRPTIRDLRLLVRRSGEDNDLIELTAKTPRLADLANTVFPRAVVALQRTQPVLDYIRPYTPDLAGWVTKFGQGANTYDANGHYARISPLFNAFSLGSTPTGDVLNAAPPSQRLGGLETRQTEKCPGGATQYPPDGSAPFRDDPPVDCNPEAQPPGP